MKIITENEIFDRLSKRYNTKEFEIVKYTKVTQPIVIKCLKCGKITNHSICSNLLSGKKICECQDRHKEKEKEIISIIDKDESIEFIKFGYKKETQKHIVEIHCKDCNQNYIKTFQDFKKNHLCSYCKTKQKMNAQSYLLKIPKEYELMSKYNGNENKVLLRHKCGFIWKVKPHTLNYYFSNGYFGCPKCNHKKSKGEQKITMFLKERNINFEIEKSFNWQSNLKYRYDFFLPDYNLIIEYNGQQHYIKTNFFHGTLEEQQEADRIKQKEAEDNGFNYLIIPYYDFQKIDEILVQRLSLDGSST